MSAPSSARPRRDVPWLIAAQGVAVGAGVFAMSGVWRRVGIVETGRFGFAVSVTAVVGLLAELGVRYAAIREMALAPDVARAIYERARRVRWALAGAAFLLLCLATASLPSLRHEAPLLLLAGVVAVTQFGNDTGSWVMFGRGRVDRGAMVLILDRLLFLGGLYTAAALGARAEGLLLGILAANLVRTALSTAWARPLLKESAATGGPSARRLLATGGGLGVAVLTAVLFPNLTLIGMKLLARPEDLGHYAIAFGTFTLLMVAPTSATTALFPLLVAAGPDPSSAPRAARINLLLAAPLAAAVLLFGPYALQTWIGRAEPATVGVLRVLALALIPSALNFSYRLVLFAVGRPGIETRVNAAAIAVIVILAVPVVRAWGGAGLAILYLAMECAALVAKLWLAARAQSVSPAHLLPPGLVAAVAWIAAAAASVNAPFAWRLAVLVAGGLVLLPRPAWQAWRSLAPPDVTAAHAEKAGPWPA